MTLVDAVRQAVMLVREGKHAVITRVRTDCAGDIDRPGIHFTPSTLSRGYRLEELYGYGRYGDFHGFSVDDTLAADWRLIGEHDYPRFRDGSLERKTR